MSRAAMTSPTVNLAKRGGDVVPFPASNGARLSQWGAWGDAGEALERARRGHAPGFVGMSAAGRIFPVSTILSQRLLTPMQAWRIYTTSPDVRFCVDSIVRRVATWDWRIVPTVDPRDKRYETLASVAADTTAWLAAPNLDGLTWQEVWTEVGIDLLVHDAGALELVAGKGGVLEEVAPLPGREVYPRVNEYNRTIEYVQDPMGYATAGSGYAGGSDTAGTPVVRFDPQEVLYLRLFPNTTGPLGLPLIESCLNEVVSVLLASEQAMSLLDANEIPPGLLVLGGIAGDALEVAKSDLQRMKGREGKLRVIGGEHGAVDAKWLELRRAILGVEMKSIVDEARRAIWRTFGIMPIEAGVTDNTPRAVGEVMAEMSNSHLLRPILELLAGKVNARLLPRVVAPRFAKLLRFEFDFDQKLKPDEAAKQRDSKLGAVKVGAMTLNEWRASERLPLYGAEGDVPMIFGSDGTLRRLVDAIVEPVKAEVPPAEGSGEAGGGNGGPGDVEDEPEPEPPKGGKGKGDGGGVKDTDGETGEDGEAAAPGKRSSRAEAHVHGLGCRHDHAPDVRTWPNPENDLPSDWQPEGRFKGLRTIDLPEAARQIVAYRDAVLPRYRDASAAIAEAVARHHEPGSEARDDADASRKAVDGALAKLRSTWSASTESIYVDAAKAGRTAAATWTEGSSPDLAAAAVAGREYHEKAVGYLTAQGGLLETMGALAEIAIARLDGAAMPARSAIARAEGEDEAESSLFDDLLASIGTAIGAELLASLVSALTASKKPTSAAAMLAALGPASTKAEAEAALAAVLGAQANRIDNWSGKVVDLTTKQASAQATEDANRRNADPNRNPEDPAESWFIENVDAGGRDECDECLDESRKGFVAVASVTSWPGERVCEGRCRCVAVWHTAAEVAAGTAVSLAANGRAGDAAPNTRADKYADIDFSPPAGVRAECRKGVDWYEAGEGGDGLKPETVRWARKLRDGDDITPAKARKMRAWLARHEVDKDGTGFSPGEDGYPSPGRVAWALWGGDPAVGWSSKLVDRMDAADDGGAE